MNAVPAVHWRQRAACARVDPELFFPVGTTGPALAQTAAAKAVCGHCPVIGACRGWALATREPSGIWGGLSEQERRALLARPAAGVRPVPTRRWPLVAAEKCYLCVGEPGPGGCRRCGGTGVDPGVARGGAA